MPLKVSFVNFNEKGLKPLVTAFGKKGLTVVQVKATNIGKREAGYLVKRAMFVFETGQKLVLAMKANGSIFQVKLNGKALPVKNDKDLDAALGDIIRMVKANEERYIKARDKRLEKAALAAVKQVQKKNASTSILKQIEEHRADLEDKNRELEGAKQAMTEAMDSLATRQGVLTGLEEQLTELLTTKENLLAEINALQEAA